MQESDKCQILASPESLAHITSRLGPLVQPCLKVIILDYSFTRSIKILFFIYNLFNRFLNFFLSGISCIHMAAVHPDLKVLRQLLSNGGDVNIQVSIDWKLLLFTLVSLLSNIDAEFVFKKIPRLLKFRNIWIFFFKNKMKFHSLQLNKHKCKSIHNDCYVYWFESDNLDLKNYCQKFHWKR